MKISIVIPVYNEAEQLAACLDAIAAQTVRPFEVIVVDNNSSDGTVAIAESFDFVQLLHESRQGVVHARTTGFNAATGEIIARIDADTMVPPDWLQQVQLVMADDGVDAVSGAAQYYNMSAAKVLSAVDLFFRRRLAVRLKDRVYLWGANMALRRSAWLNVRAQLCNRGGLHEDFDLAIHLQECGYRVMFDERVQAAVSSRRVDSDYLAFMRYVLRSPDTYAQHRIIRRLYMYEVVILCAVCYIPLRIMHRGYDPVRRGFSPRQVFQSTIPRPDPTNI
jgi:glycosyltransferase involved in cell wall biosynthesis